MFGRLNDSYVVNVIIIVAKQFIVGQRFRDELVSMNPFRYSMLKMFMMEKTNACAKSKLDGFRERWKYLIDESDALSFFSGFHRRFIERSTHHDCTLIHNTRRNTAITFRFKRPDVHW